MILIVDGNRRSNTWPKGRIITTQPGADGAVRKVPVQTENATYDRPAVKFAIHYGVYTAHILYWIQQVIGLQSHKRTQHMLYSCRA